MNKVIYGECLEEMKKFPDNHFDLCMTDPPYGILNKTKRGGQRSPHKYKIRAEKWDFKPSKEYFDELIRISKHQIIWGGLFFTDILKPTQGWIFWDKKQPVKNFARGEMAWTSFDFPLKYFEFMYYGNINSDPNRQHPTQKPVELFSWILENYTKEGETIIDPFAGSGTTAISCINMGRKYTLIEKEKEYIDIINKRIETHLDGNLLEYAK